MPRHPSSLARRVAPTVAMPGLLAASITVAGAADVPVVIKVGDPEARVARLAVNGFPVDAHGLGTPQVVYFQPEDEEGVECNADIAVTLESGIHVSRAVNLCEGGFAVSIGVPRPDLSLPRRPPEPELAWQGYAPDPAAGDTARFHLDYGIPQTDARLVGMSCAPGAGFAEVNVTQFHAPVAPGGTGAMEWVAEGIYLVYEALAGDPQSFEEPDYLRATLSIDDPLFGLLKSHTAALLRLNGSEYLTIPLASGSSAFDTFLAGCRDGGRATVARAGLPPRVDAAEQPLPPRFGATPPAGAPADRAPAQPQHAALPPAGDVAVPSGGVDPFPRTDSGSGYQRVRQYFGDYMATCATDGVCEAVTFTQIPTESGQTYMSNLALRRGPSPGAGWEVTYTGTFEGPAPGSQTVAAVDGEPWNLFAGDGWDRHYATRYFKPPYDGQLLPAMRAGMRLEITETLESGHARSVGYSLRGLTAAIRWINDRQGRAPDDLALRRPQSD